MAKAKHEGHSRPERQPDPEPMRANEVLVIGVGTGLWAVALVVTLALRHTLERHDADWWIWTCVVGVALGVLGLWVVARRARRTGR